MRIWPLLLTMATLSAGCSIASLKRNTLDQLETLSDLRYKENLNNFAALADNRAVLPSYASIFAGTTIVSETESVNPTTVIGRETVSKAVRGVSKVVGTVTHLQSENLDLMGTHRVTDNWTLDPVAVPEKLEAMRFAYLWVLDGPESLPPEAMRLLGKYEENNGMPPGHYFEVAEDLARMPPGWLHVGCLGDVPLHAPYKAHRGSTWIWVCADGMAGFSTFALVIHKIARTETDSTFHPKPAVRTVAKEVAFTQRRGELDARDAGPKDGPAKQPEENPLKVTVKMTAFVDSDGNLVADANSYAFPFKKRKDDIGANAFTRSVIAASAGSKLP